MPSPSWRTPAILVITAPCDASVLTSSTADAVVVEGSVEGISLDAIIAARPDLPVVMLANVDHDGELALIAQGADQVLPAGASLREITRAVGQAIARRSRLPRERRSAATETGPFVDAPQLRAIARLSGGIAHEFNNLLTVIAASVEQLVHGLPEAHPLRDAAGAIDAAAREAAVLTRQLLAFGRQQTLMPAAVSINALIADALPLLRASLGDRVQVHTELTRDLPAVRVDRDQMIEVLSNLAAIAREAMPDGGSFTMATDLHTVTDEERRHRPWLPAGRFVRVRLGDTGLGMEEQVLPHLFEPFFSGVPSARGKGLTMSSVYGVVKQSGGYIWVDSRVNRGTTVTILLPGIEQPPPRREPRERTGGSIRVLLVEDTDAVRQTLTSMLEWHGFTVVGAATAHEAIELARTQRVDVLLTDVALPEKNGPELAAEFRAMFPGTPVIFMSGYSANSIDPRDLDSPRAFLQKPFPVQMLVERIHEMLAHAGARESGVRN